MLRAVCYDAAGTQGGVRVDAGRPNAGVLPPVECVQAIASRWPLRIQPCCCACHTLGGPSSLHPTGHPGTPEVPCARLCQLNPQGSSTFCGHLKTKAPGHLHPEEDAHPTGGPRRHPALWCLSPPRPPRSHSPLTWVRGSVNLAGLPPK